MGIFRARGIPKFTPLPSRSNGRKGTRKKPQKLKCNSPARKGKDGLRESTGRLECPVRQDPVRKDKGSETFHPSNGFSFRHVNSAPRRGFVHFFSANCSNSVRCNSGR